MKNIAAFQNTMFHGNSSVRPRGTAKSHIEKCVDICRGKKPREAVGWSFTIDLTVPPGGLKQTGTFSVDSSGHPLSLDTNATTNGAVQGEKLAFANGNVTCDLTPTIPAISHSFPVDGHPYLLINNLISLLSLATRANHDSLSAGLVLKTFSANALRPVLLTLKPLTTCLTVGKDYKSYQATLSVEGMPDSTSIYWLSNITGEIIRVIDNGQGLDVIKS